MRASNMETEAYYFYLWQHRFVDPDTDQILERVCFGITSNPERRLQAYEGHCGHRVRFSALWTGPERLVRDIERKIKEESHDSRFVGLGNFRYEWINETVPYQDFHDWVSLTLIPGVIGVEPCDPVTFAVNSPQ